MFQYAAGLATARRLGVSYELDLTPFEGRYSLHKYGLAHLNITAAAAAREDIKKLRNRRLKSLPKFMRPSLEKKRTHYRNLSLDFDPRVLSLPDPVYLEGYFQSERYFKSIEREVRAEFAFRTPPSPENESFVDLIANSPNASAIHVRRGDYVSDAKTNARHGTCSPAYYRESMRVLLERVGRASAFVFSDDPDWAEENLDLGVPTCIVRHNPPEKGHEDLRLMTQCKHFIIANSSFSWWGAWLSISANKLVLGPERWMRDPNLNLNDVYPSEWIKVSG